VVRDALRHLGPPGVVVNAMKGDPEEARAHRWLAWRPERLPDWALVGVPYDGASVVRSGSRHGPDAVRAAMRNFTTYMTSTRRLLSLDAGDVGDLEVVLTDMATTFDRVTHTVRAIRAAGSGLVLVGGDHSLSFPILRGLTEACDGQIGVIHFDQHHDLREAHFGAESSGVPFRKALELDHAPIRGHNLVQVGISDLANAARHAEYAERQGVTVITNTEVRAEGMQRCADRALRLAGDATEAIHVSVDIDCIDQSQAPGTAAPNPNGLDARDVYAAVRAIARDPLVNSLDVVEISPELEPGSLTGAVGATIALWFLVGVSERGGDEPE
jgi:formimidoylglutamase